MRLPQKLLLWGQMSDMLKVPRLLLGTRVGPCKQVFMNPLWWVLWLWAVLQGKGDEQPVNQEGWRCLLSVSFRLGRSRCLMQQQKGIWGVPEMVLQMETGRRQREGEKGKFFVSFCNQRTCDFLEWLELLHKRLQMPGFVHKGRIPLFFIITIILKSLLKHMQMICLEQQSIWEGTCFSRCVGLLDFFTH